MLLRWLLLSLFFITPWCFADQTLIARPDVSAFMQELIQQDGFNRRELVTLLSQAKPQPAILHLIQRPYEALPWRVYRKHFMTEARIKHGVEFWQKNHKTLRKASQEFGVEPEYIVAILGVETSYGAHMADYRVLDALVTLAFDYPPRAKFFRSELKAFLKLAKQHKIRPEETYGSYAGAMGMPQFMPSSLSSYGVDYDHDGVIDFFHNPIDAIGSVANYLKRHGWVKGGTFAVPAKAADKQYEVAIKQQDKRRRSQHLRPKYRVETLKTRFHITPKYPVSPKTKATVFTLQGKRQHLWLGLNNFYVITTYNISKNYAMAVRALAKEVKQRYQQRNLTTVKNTLPKMHRAKINEPKKSVSPS